MKQVLMGKGKIEVRETPAPAISENEVLIKVAFTGICGTDLLIVSGKHPRVKSTLIPCHEFSGVIEEVGANVSTFTRFQRVVVNPLISCGECNTCKSGKSHICEKLKLYGVDRPGGFGQFVSVPELQYR